MWWRDFAHRTIGSADVDLAQHGLTVSRWLDPTRTVEIGEAETPIVIPGGTPPLGPPAHGAIAIDPDLESCFHRRWTTIRWRRVFGADDRT